MTYLLVLLAGVLIGAGYALSRVKSPAPPPIALIGLCGMLLAARLLPAR
jgi:XapX domain-containing protein